MRDALRGEIRPAIVLFLLMTVVTGIVYPVIVTGIGRVLFPQQTRGLPGLIGQEFTAPCYFWGRPSATNPAYNATASSGSNLGPTNPALVDSVRARIARLRRADPGNAARVPVDLVTASASGLDPDLSPAAALYQVHRVAQARGIDEALVRRLIRSRIQGRQLGLFGEPRVNVLRLNQALDDLSRQD
jgi:potassium-transporting ATPase KdpC subunit